MTDMSALLQLTDEQEHIRKTVAAFMEREVAPHVDRWENEEELPREIFTKFAEIGLAGMECPREYGGSDMSFLTSAIVNEEVGRVYRPASFINVHSMIVSLVVRHGDDEQRRQWLPGLVDGRTWAVFALTEPDAGSDVASMRSRAVLDGDEWVLNGTKVFISNADRADVLAVAAKTEDGKRGQESVSVFLVPRDSPGLHIPRWEPKLAYKSHHTCQVDFVDCRVPRQNLLGERGRGMPMMLGTLSRSRINVGAMAVGASEFCLEQAMAYAKERVQFGRPLADNQAIQFKLADMATQLDAARLLVYRAAAMLDAGQPARKEASMAKCFATEMAWTVADQALQIFGGYGFLSEYKIERYLREARLGTIAEGTSEMQRITIARELLAGR